MIIKPVILCVDDEETVLLSLEQQLKRCFMEQYDIEVAADAETALLLLEELLAEKIEVPVVIADQIMPGMQGDQFLVQVHAVYPRILNILLTGQAHADAVGNAVNNANLYHYIAKPWEPEDLNLTVSEAVRRYFQDKKLEEQNQMLQEANIELGKLNKTQEAYSHTLEQQVAERTKALEQTNRELQRLANLDGLTQIANRRYFDRYLRREWRRLAREQAPLSLLLCDIDHFKEYNDTCGHQGGDDCLSLVARMLSQNAKRSTDLAARYGGDEFAVILPNTNIHGAALVAQHVQEEMKQQHVTLSIGAACEIPVPNTSSDRLIAAADKALYTAKAQGRDRFILANQ
ncbi:MAG: diguanylate cyclase [Gammaproteobacteria bacterium]|nr:diguanylate cyclase [Gammaproteobacteria bacterium]